MNGGQIGEIPLEDYIKIVGTKKTPPVKRLSRVAGIVALCTLCMAAGDYLAMEREASQGSLIRAGSSYGREPWTTGSCSFGCRAAAPILQAKHPGVRCPQATRHQLGGNCGCDPARH